MAKAGFELQELQAIVRIVEHALRQGARPSGVHGVGRSAIEVAAEECARAGLCKGHASVRRRIQAASSLGVEVDWSLYRAPQYQKPVEVAKEIPVFEPGMFAAPTGEVLRVCVIPDIHVDPSISNERLTWIGKWCADNEPTHVVQLGDWLTLDSMSNHAQPGSKAHSITPTLKDDIEAGLESAHLFDSAFGDKGVKRILCEGNHEYRAQRFEESSGKLDGIIVPRVKSIFEDIGFRVVPYGEYVFVGGVGFIHHVNNGIGRPYGGKTAAQRIATDSVFSIVHGHTHNKQSADVAKVGPNLAVRAISAGCALPYGHIEQYAKHSTTGWFWGVLFLSICDGQILDEHWTSMLTLERRYKSNKKGGAKAAL